MVTWRSEFRVPLPPGHARMHAHMRTLTHFCPHFQDILLSRKIRTLMEDIRDVETLAESCPDQSVGFAPLSSISIIMMENVVGTERNP